MAQLETTTITDDMKVCMLILVSHVLSCLVASCSQDGSLGRQHLIAAHGSGCGFSCIGSAKQELTPVWLQSFGAYRQLRQERTNERLAGKRAKKAADMAAEEKDKAK